MLSQRKRAADAVARDFLQAEGALDQAAQHAAQCVATMLTQRSEAGLPLATGLKAIDQISALSADVLRLRERFVQAHLELKKVRDEIGLRNFYGDEFPCPEARLESSGSPMVRLATAA